MPLREDPGRSAILTDLDGTLAPITARPEQARVPEATRAALRKAGEKFGLVACVSGRRAAEARDLVGLPGIAYSGNHGLELLWPGEEEPRLDPALEGRERLTAEFADALDPASLASAGLRLEDKGPIQALHWRGVEDEAAAEELARTIAAEAERRGLHPHWGRKVLELRPTDAVGKNVAVGSLIAAADVRAAVYAGDDRTDLDAFRRLRELRETGRLETAVCVGVLSDEAPRELAGESDYEVDGPDGWRALLESLVA